LCIQTLNFKANTRGPALSTQGHQQAQHVRLPPQVW